MMQTISPDTVRVLIKQRMARLCWTPSELARQAKMSRQNIWRALKDDGPLGIKVLNRLEAALTRGEKEATQ